MTRWNLLSSRALAIGVLYLATGSLGCSSHDKPVARGYCDDSGCYQCDIDGACWPLPKERCTGDEQCQPGERCTDVGCMATCSESADCAAGERCVEGLCAPEGFARVNPYEPPAACQQDDDCSPDKMCSGGQCLPRCKADDDCGQGQVCSPCGKCQPEEAPATCGAVVAYCSETTSCGSGKICINGRCHFHCSSSSGCPVGQICSAGICAENPSPASPSCVIDIDCHAGACINGYCHLHCESSTTCGSGELCLMGVCQPDYHPAQ